LTRREVHDRPGATIAPAVDFTLRSLAAAAATAASWSGVKKSASLTPAPWINVGPGRVKASSMPASCRSSMAWREYADVSPIASDDVMISVASINPKRMSRD
jgi:hypothetical protein